MGSCAAPSAKGDDKFITTDYLQQCLKYCPRKLSPSSSSMKIAPRKS
ncbi:replication initiator protein [Citrobacter freundii]|nr:replication initiator protein [Citrobacter freundii]